MRPAWFCPWQAHENKCKRQFPNWGTFERVDGRDFHGAANAHFGHKLHLIFQITLLLSLFLIARFLRKNHLSQMYKIYSMIWELYKQDPLMEMTKVKQEFDYYNVLSFLIEIEILYWPAVFSNISASILMIFARIWVEQIPTDITFARTLFWVEIGKMYVFSS